MSEMFLTPAFEMQIQMLDFIVYIIHSNIVLSCLNAFWWHYICVYSIYDRVRKKHKLNGCGPSFNDGCCFLYIFKRYFFYSSYHKVLKCLIKMNVTIKIKMLSFYFLQNT